MNGHLFGQSGRSGVDRCRCGTERELRGVDAGRPYWWFWRQLPRGSEEASVKALWACRKAKAAA